MCIVQVVIDFPLRVLDLKPIHNISKIFNMTDMGSPCIRKYDKLTVSSLALAARATRDYMRCQERDWQALSHFSTSLTQQETAFHRSTVARRSRSRSARGGRSRRRRRDIGAQLLIDVTVKPRAEGSQQETAIHRSTVAHRCRCRSARRGRSRRRRYIGAQLLIEVAVNPREGRGGVAAGARDGSLRGLRCQVKHHPLAHFAACRQRARPCLAASTSGCSSDPTYQQVGAETYLAFHSNQTAHQRQRQRIVTSHLRQHVPTMAS